MTTEEYRIAINEIITRHPDAAFLFYAIRQPTAGNLFVSMRPHNVMMLEQIAVLSSILRQNVDHPLLRSTAKAFFQQHPELWKGAPPQ